MTSSQEKGLSADEVFDRATWRRMSSYNDPHTSGNRIKRKKKYDSAGYLKRLQLTACVTAGRPAAMNSVITSWFN